VGVAAAFNGASYKRARRRSGEAVDGAEVNLELTYLAPVVPWLALQGDVQYVVDPDTDPDLANAVVIAVRLLISL
jgi:porin